MLNLLVNSKKLWQTLTVLIAAVILFGIILAAFASGRASSEAKLVLKDVEGISIALEYFYSDQDRFPTAFEFGSINIMGLYLEPFPPEEIISKNCPQSLKYTRSSVNSYELYFCLPKKEGSFNEGWNKKSVTK